MKYKRLYSKSIRLSNNMNKQHKRCPLCDSLLKTHRYLSMNKSIHESIIINNIKTITYAECCQRYLKEMSIFKKLPIICLKCSDNLQRIHSLHLDAEKLTENLRRLCTKTKNLNKIRQSYSKTEMNVDIKEEPITIELVSPSVISNIQPFNTINSTIIPSEIFSNEYYQNLLNRHTINSTSALHYEQFLIESPTTTHISHQERQTDSNNEQISLDDDRSLSPSINDDDNGIKTTRLNRRQYNFLLELPDQQSLNAFIEASAAESHSRWTWRRTSANSRGYKIYYVCNFSMRRHYHPCSAAMYALFHPEGSISIYSYGQHQHIPKNRLPLSITDETKSEVFKCLQTGMSTSDIREHLTQHNLPFGDTKKLNNFIKYHKELLRFGAVTNIRLNGSAYRQPQCWAIRQPSKTTTATTNNNNNNNNVVDNLNRQNN